MAYTIPDAEAQADDLGQLQSHAKDLLAGFHQNGLDDLQRHAQSVADDLTQHVQSAAMDSRAALQTGISSLQDHAQSLLDGMDHQALDLQGPASQRSGGATDMAPPPAPAAPQATTGQDRRDSAPATTGAADPNDLHAYARAAAQRNGLDPDIFERQIQQESGFRVDAGSPAGAQGIAQFMPETAKSYGVDVTDPRSSLDGAARMMRDGLTRNGGDYSKALAAYNAGQGAVDKYNGIPPFEETQRYVSTILGDKRPTAAPGPITPSDAGDRKMSARQSQFGDKDLTPAEAYAACGPAAALWAANNNGATLTLRQATDLAKQVGWSEGQGMAGISSEQQLLSKMGVKSRLDSSMDWDAVTRDASTGNPVIISTPGHYFTVDGVMNGKYHVGTSGTDLKGGSDWMTVDEMQARMGTATGALFVDHPGSATPSVAVTQPQAGGGSQSTTMGAMQSADGALDLQNPNPRAQRTSGQDRRDSPLPPPPPPQFDPQGQAAREDRATVSDVLPQYDPQGQNARDARTPPQAPPPVAETDAPPPPADVPATPSAWDSIQADAARLADNLRAKGEPLADAVGSLKDRIDQAILAGQPSATPPAPQVITPPMVGPPSPDKRYPQAPPWLVTPKTDTPLDRSIRDSSTQLTGPEQLSAGVDTYRGATASRNQFIAQNNPIAGLKNANGDPMFGAEQVASITSGLAGMAADPSSYVVGGKIASVVDAALGRAATAGEIGALEQVLKQGGEGALFGTHVGLQDPDATPESVGLSAAQMAAGNVGLHLGGKAIAVGTSRAATAGFEALDKASPPEVAYASSYDGHAARMAQYSAEERAGLQDFAKQQADAGIPQADIDATLTDWMNSNPPADAALGRYEDPAVPADVTDAPVVSRGKLGGRYEDGTYVRPDYSDVPPATQPDGLMAAFASSIEQAAEAKGRKLSPEIQARIDGARTADDMIDTARRAGVDPDVVADMQAQADRYSGGGSAGRSRYPDVGQQRLDMGMSDEALYPDTVGPKPPRAATRLQPLDIPGGVMEGQEPLANLEVPAETQASAVAAAKAARLAELQRQLEEHMGGGPSGPAADTGLNTNTVLPGFEERVGPLQATAPEGTAPGGAPSAADTPEGRAFQERNRAARIAAGQRDNLEPQLPTMADDVGITQENPARPLATDVAPPAPVWKPDAPTDTEAAASDKYWRSKQNSAMLNAKDGPTLRPDAKAPPVQGTATGFEVARHIIINNIISGPATATKILANSVLSPVLHVVGATAADLSPIGRKGLDGRVGLRMPQVDRLQGRMYGTAVGYAKAGQELAASIHDIVTRRNTGSEVGRHFADPNWIGNRLPDAMNNRVVKGLIGGGDIAGGALHQALQSATATVVRHMELGAAAGEVATLEKLSSPAAWASRLAELMEHPEQLPVKSVQQAIDTGSDAALRRPLGRAGAATSKYVHDTAWGWLLPITRIPLAAASKVMEYSPIGALDAAKDVGLAKMGRGPYAEPKAPTGPFRSPEAMQTAMDAFQKQHDAWQGYDTYGSSTTPLNLRLQHSATGTALALWLISKAGETSDDPKEHPFGWVTGSGPDNADDRNKMIMAGWRPDSVWWNGAYRNFQGFHGVSASLAAAGNFHDAMAYGAHGGNVGAFGLDLVGRMSEFVADETYGLPQVAGLYDMLRGGPGGAAAAGRFVGTTLVNDLVPAALRSVAAASDSAGERAVDTRVDKTEDPDKAVQGWNTFLRVTAQSVENAIPGLRQNVPLKRDALGRVQPNSSAGADVVLPKGNTATADPTGIVKAFVDADVTLPALPTTVSTPNDGAGMDLTSAEARDVQGQIGDRVTDLARETISSPEWKNYSTETKHYVLTAILSAARRSVEAEFLGSRSPSELRLTSAGGRLEPGHGGRIFVKNPKYPDEAP